MKAPAAAIAFATLAFLSGQACGQGGKKQMTVFAGKNAPLERAIDANDPAAVEAAVKGGAGVNASGAGGARPAMYALGKGRTQAFERLLSLGADPSLRDNDGDNVMTMAATAYARHPEFLAAALKAGGDPNTRRPNGDPILMRFVADQNLDGIRLLVHAGADVNARDRTKSPLVISAAIVEYWDVVWTLLELGAKFDYPNEPVNLPVAFRTPKVTPPDSPMFPYKVKAWSFLKSKGMALPDLEGAH